MQHYEEAAMGAHAEASEQLPGASIRRLRCGALTFTAHEIGEGPLALLLHGFPDAPGTWRLLAPALAAAGYRAVAVTMRGYEASSRVAEGDYRPEALAEDVISWIDALEAPAAHVIGHDWGSVVGFAAAAAAPDRVTSLTMMAVPNPYRFARVLRKDLGQLRRSWYMLFFMFEGLSERVVRRRNCAFVDMLWRRWSPGWRAPEDHLAEVRRMLAEPDALTAALGYYREALRAKAPPVLPQVAAPTLALAGAKDACISAEIFERCMKPSDFPGGLGLARIEDAGHFLHLERPEAVAQHVLAHLHAHA